MERIQTGGWNESWKKIAIAMQEPKILETLSKARFWKHLAKARISKIQNNPV